MAGDISSFASEAGSSPKREFLAVESGDVDNINYFSQNVGSPKEVIEKNKSGTPTYKKVYFYYKQGGGYTKIYSYDVPTKKWREK